MEPALAYKNPYLRETDLAASTLPAGNVNRQSYTVRRSGVLMLVHRAYSLVAGAVLQRVASISEDGAEDGELGEAADIAKLYI